jgi:indole-3-glycerol phosphate synthase
MQGDILTQIVAHKKEEVRIAQKRMPESLLKTNAVAVGHCRPFFDKLSTAGAPGVNVIAEIKRASPSKGIIRADLNPADQAQGYARGGAAAVSVLTDAHYFKGSYNDLILARNAVDLPVLRKDFIISTYQIYESRAFGADAILLIARILTPQQLRKYLALCRELNMTALVEVHSEEEMAVATMAGAKLIGINNRDLKTFQTDIKTTTRLAARLTAGQVGVAESGIRSREDIAKVRSAGIFNFLIGESLVRADDPEKFLKSLVYGEIE